MNRVELAKDVLTKNSNVLYGIFGVIASSGYFPPSPFLNEFLMVGYDPCDQDERMGRWRPFFLSDDEYDQVLGWWRRQHPEATVNQLGVRSWNEWVQEILEN
ncbi:hypothetical protein [Amphritea pacifica]|uniref:Uncharacterized protein n=1 Tax=Amphritea pacifica TaxID=2811233 RepID=A0ABS2WDY2_9GAMM|nr:hypothetical protein [Amphritea pacifica]MBN0989928.1 hypothetical protein [Amphritea pacifica]